MTLSLKVITLTGDDSSTKRGAVQAVDCSIFL